MLTELVTDKAINITIKFTDLNTQQTLNKVIKITINNQEEKNESEKKE